MLVAIMIAAGCNRADHADRRSDTIDVTPPVDVEAPAGEGDSGQDGSASSHDCGLHGAPVLADQGLGELRPGRSVADIRKVCDVVSDSQQPGTEGMMERILVVRVAGEPVRSLISDDRILRLEVTSPLFKTPDSLGVDTPLRRIARKRGAVFVPGEGGIYAFVADHCGLSFRFSLPLRPPARGVWTAESIEKAHGDAAVDRVLVTKCER